MTRPIQPLLSTTMDSYRYHNGVSGMWQQMNCSDGHASLLVQENKEK